MSDPADDVATSAARAELLRRLRRGSATPAATARTLSSTRRQRVISSPIQEALLSVEYHDGPVSQSRIMHCLWIEGEFDEKALAESLQLLIDRHESLRTWFDFEGDTAWQNIEERAEIELVVDTLDGVPQARREAEAYRRAGEASEEAFDLRTAPLMRARLWRVHETLRLLLVVAHHAVADGHSLGVATDEVSATYLARTAGETVELPSLSHQYRDYSAAARDWLASEQAKAQGDWWFTRLAGRSVATLPEAREDVQPTAEATGTLSFDLGHARSAAVTERARTEDVTVFMVVLTALKLAFAEATGSPEVAFGMAVANRGRPETAQMIGMLADLVVVRTDVGSAPSYASALQRVRESTTGALAHQEYTFGIYINRMEPDRNLHEDPFYVATVIVQPPPVAVELPALTLRHAPLAARRRRHTPAFHLWTDGDLIRGTVNFDPDRLPEPVVSRLIDRTKDFLTAMTDLPSDPLPFVEP